MKVSVIIPAYNVSEYIEACIESVMTQSYPDLEVIVIDDGSTDDTLEKLEKLKEQFPHLTIYHKENGGLSAARNDGVKYATGTYLAFVDSDDVIDRTMYEKMVQSLEKQDAEIVTIGVSRLRGEDVYPSVLHEHFMKETKIGTNLHESHELLYDTTSWNKLYKRSFWEENQFAFPVGKTFEDIPVTLPAYLKAEHVNLLPCVGYYWRYRTSKSRSITQQKNNLRMVNDRLDALCVCDAAFESSGDSELIEAKTYKFLEIDLFSMIEWLFTAPKSDFKAIRERVIAYLNQTDSSKVFSKLPLRKQKMFTALLKNRTVAFKYQSRMYFLEKAFRRIFGQSKNK
ncbi:glycosyl transferase family protein [Listeria floridensis FSL S10-1187]|uniref:Glycosyl transferase family protein n=1 Tax=Listeria floridensis FSL S10-1187 TaxID=1265817 RepID=A0ABP3AXB0_9LIST|nr:glycosyltransferase family 2 protein [Listeria floridensis]EUJ27437.1 glycosyl transferase family protein [Listeria floridensis FSL S10-1187]